MGMDVYGKNPTAEVGEYFRRNVWGWHPLWDLASVLAPDLIDDELLKTGHYNDGAGMDADGAKALAKRLRESLDNGVATSHVDQFQAGKKALPDEKCDLCDETGARTDAVGKKYGFDKPNGCNGCRNDTESPPGYHRPFVTAYDVDLGDVMEFAAFLEESGGFEIW